jgi:hypothetical protein
MTHRQLKRHRRIILAYLYSVSLLIGFLGMLAVGPGAEGLPLGFAWRTHWLTTILFSLGCMWFCTIDARLAGRPLIQLAKQGIFLFWPAGVPIYLLSVRGIRGFGVLLLHGFGLLVACLCSAFATACLLYVRLLVLGVE